MIKYIKIKRARQLGKTEWCIDRAIEEAKKGKEVLFLVWRYDFIQKICKRLLERENTRTISHGQVMIIGVKGKFLIEKVSRIIVRRAMLTSLRGILADVIVSDEGNMVTPHVMLIDLHMHIKDGGTIYEALQKW